MVETKYLVLGYTHIDLAWMNDKHEMAEMFDIFVIRLLDILENYPSYKYILEQAAHFRGLAGRRPDLAGRLKHFIQEGRLEVVGGMASTMETNVPNGECFVRNQFLGMWWVKENFGVDIKTGWLADTFGINAQVPQILKQFGINYLMATRFGGVRNHDVFISKGLDGSEIPVAGRDNNAPYIHREHIFDGFIKDWNDTDRIFKAADEAKGDGPYLVILGNEMKCGSTFVLFITWNKAILVNQENGSLQ